MPAWEWESVTRLMPTAGTHKQTPEGEKVLQEFL